MTIPTVEAARTEVFGIRHHGPGSARSLVASLHDYQPDCVLIEGPADADGLVDWVLAEQMQPPIAILAYAAGAPKIASFWPFAVFSPEWQALVWAAQRGVETRFCDLPAAISLAPPPRTLLSDEPEADAGPPVLLPGAAPEASSEPDHRADASVLDRLTELATSDPLRAMAEAAGYDDPERWWEDLVEGRLDGSSPFPFLTEAMAELRALLAGSASADGRPRPGLRNEERERCREAYMRQAIRAALKRGRRRVAVVCGAWHAPALTSPLPPAAADARLLRGLPKRKVMLTWVPWTHQRLASASGYGAGITSPGWYQHLWNTPEQPVVHWMTQVAGSLRRHDLPVSSAHVIEAVRLAETLANIRDRPLAGLAEVTDATRAVLCDGNEIALRFVTDELVVGQTLGTVDERVPTVPLEADLIATCRTLRVRREVQPRRFDLDLRRGIDQARSILFHRLRLLELDWVRPAEAYVENQGTFRESWQALWHPEYAVAVVEASVWGTTVEQAATVRVQQTAADGNLLELTAAVRHCLLADLSDARDVLLAALADRAALDADLVHLMDALPALAQGIRYGDVRQSDTRALREVGETMFVRVCAGLTGALTNLDEASATAMRRRLDEVNAALGLIIAPAGGPADPGPGGTRSGDHLRENWLAALGRVLDRSDVHGVLAGRVVRLLMDADRLDDAEIRVERALSHGAAAAAKAAWVDGFFSDGALLLVHDAGLRQLLDRWVSGLPPQEFTDLLPLLRRTFATFTPAERRTIGERLTAPPASMAAREPADDAIDLARAAPALATVELLLGPP